MLTMSHHNRGTVMNIRIVFIIIVTLAFSTTAYAEISTQHQPVVPEKDSRTVVKMSRSGICHDTSSKYYTRTKNFTPYNSLEECLKAGGRLPKR